MRLPAIAISAFLIASAPVWAQDQTDPPEPPEGEEVSPPVQEDMEPAGPAPGDDAPPRPPEGEEVQPPLEKDEEPSESVRQDATGTPRPPSAYETSPPPTDPEGRYSQQEMLKMHQQMHDIQEAEAERDRLMKEHRGSMQANQPRNPAPIPVVESYEKNIGKRLDEIEKKLDQIISNQNGQ